MHWGRLTEIGLLVTFHALCCVHQIQRECVVKSPVSGRSERERGERGCGYSDGRGAICAASAAGCGAGADRLVEFSYCTLVSVMPFKL